MDKKMEFTRGNPQEDAPKRIAKKDLRRWLRLGLVALVLVAVVTTALLWDGTAFDGLRRSIIYRTAEKDENGCARLYSYAAEKDSCYASLGGSLVQATSRTVVVLGEDGQARYSADVKFTQAAVCTAGELAAVYDIGGSEIYVLSSAGLVRRLEADGQILSCAINEKGAVAVTVNRSGCKAAVTVFDEKGEKVFGFNSVDRFLMTSALTENRKQMAAVTMGQAEGSFVSGVVAYATNKTEPMWHRELSDDMVYDLAMVGRSWCAVGEAGLHFLSANGEQEVFYDFEGSYLRRCSLTGDDFAALLLGRYKTGTQTRLATVDTDGVQLATLSVDKEVLSLSAAGKYVAVLYSDELVIYDRHLEEYARLADASAAKLVLMRADGSVVLVGSDAASLYLP